MAKKFVFSFFLLLSFLVIAGTAAYAKSIMVIAAHEDDEILMAGGIMKSAVANGDTVNVVIATNGDYEGQTVGLTRIQESLNANTYLGVNGSNVHFLGYGDTGMPFSDSFLMKLYTASSDSQVFSSFVGNKTYGNPGIGASEYHFNQYGVHGDYNRSTFIGDLQAIIDQIRPDDIYTHSPYDFHGDHAAVALMVNDAIVRVKKLSSAYSPSVYQSIVHSRTTSGDNNDGSWPTRESDPSPLSAFTEPGVLSTYSPLAWSAKESVAVPSSMLTTPRTSNAKYIAISKYASQLSSTYAEGYLYSFVKTNEVFWKKDYNNVALLASVTASSENAGTNQGAVKAIDGFADGYPRYAGSEWTTTGGKAGSWIQLTWPSAQTVNKIMLYDRPNSADQITGGTLTFSDGSSIAVASLPNNGAASAITFASKTVTWVKFTINQVSSGTSNAGLAEFEVYGTGPASIGAKMEMETGTRTGSTIVDTYGSGYTGAGYIAHIDLAAGNSVSTTVNAPSTGSYNIDFRYSNGTGASSTLSVYVNGTKIKNVAFPATGAWDTTWATVTSAFTLNAGNNTIKLQYDAGNGPVDIDYIVVNSAPSVQIEMENGTRTGSTITDANGSGYSGGGYIGWLDAATGNSVSTTVNVAAAGTHNIDFRYSNGTGAGSTLSVYVNGTKIKNVTFPATGAWNTTWATVTSAFTLNAGQNTIKIQYDAGNGPADIDYIVVWQ